MVNLELKFKKLSTIAEGLYENQRGRNGTWSISKRFFPNRIVIFKRTKHDLMEKYGESHRFFILLIPLAGTGNILVDNISYLVESGRAVLIRPFQVHAYAEISDSFQWVFVKFDADFKYLPQAMHHNYYCVPENALSYIDSMLKFAIFDEDHQNFTSALPFYLLQLLSKLKPDTAYAPEKKLDILTKVESYITQNITSQLSLNQLAEEFNFSPIYFSTMFKQRFGVPPGRFVKMLRLQKACRLLVNTRLSISEIADACGFSSMAVLGKVFKREYMVTPREFRGKN